MSQGSGSILTGGRKDARMASSPPTRAACALIALALRPGELRLLHCLGLVPLATHETLATLTGDGARPASASHRGWTTPPGLARLLRWGLCDYDLPGRITAQAYRRYYLTPRGLAVLATTAGVSTAAYSRLAGAIAGTRSPTPAPRSRGTDRPYPTAAVPPASPARRGSEPCPGGPLPVSACPAVRISTGLLPTLPGAHR